MKFSIENGEQAKIIGSDYIFMSLAFVAPGTLPIKESFNKDGNKEPKTFDGKALLKTQLKCLRLEDGQPVGEEFNVYTSLLEQPKDALVAGGFYALVPPISVNTWATNDGRVGTTVVAKTVVPANQNAPKGD